ncbi:hypothetical protein DY000_02042375 [Brassica cretica]|uniref:Uncharacterized protein n=1 Tax=Brassica cretica TaxID=69181 RepID=A0ABQ7BQD1_BRACR|nr:hypothetical protein DY000_02042375 [Brassica cretica]
MNGLAVVEEGGDRIGEERERFKEGLWFGAGEEKVMMEWLGLYGLRLRLFLFLFLLQEEYSSSSYALCDLAHDSVRMLGEPMGSELELPRLHHSPSQIPQPEEEVRSSGTPVRWAQIFMAFNARVVPEWLEFH